MKVELRSALAMYGGLCVTLNGEAKMQMWSVPSWDTLQVVSSMTVKSRTSFSTVLLNGVL